MVSALKSYSASSAPPVHPSMHRPLQKKIRTFLEKMTYFHGQSIRKKAAILPTKPHTRLHLNHVVMTPVAQEHCGEPHVGVITFFPVKIPARHEEKRERWKRFSICQRLPRPLNRLPRFVFVSISPGRIGPAQHDVARSGRFTLVALKT